jgi:hypothetical protein
MADAGGCVLLELSDRQCLQRELGQDDVVRSVARKCPEIVDQRMKTMASGALLTISEANAHDLGDTRISIKSKR